jgi:hypothetical protein
MSRAGKVVAGDPSDFCALSAIGSTSEIQSSARILVG